MNPLTIRLTAYTDPAGKWNDEAPNKGNEDNMLVVSDLKGDANGSFVSDEKITLGEYGCLMVVADGMGGMNAGEVASAIAIDVVRQHFSEGKLNADIVETAESRASYMEKVVVAADDAIKQEAASNEACSGMGSTLVMAWLLGSQLTVTWCGDSRAYLFRPSVGLRQVSKDHSYVQSLVDEGKITLDEAFDHPYNNIITRSLGDPEKKSRPDSTTVDVYEGDVVMACSDGLSGALRDGEMEAILKDGRESLSGCRKALWAAAEKTWYDNVTAILCEVTSGPAAPAENAVGKTGDEGKEGNLGGSFISLKISKRALRIALPVVAVVAVGLAACLLLHNPFWKDVKANAAKIDSLATVADNAKLSFLSDAFRRISPKDADSLAFYEEVLSERLGLLSQIDGIQCDSSYVGLSRRLRDLKRQATKPQAVAKNVEDGISDAKSSLATLESILSDMDKFEKGKTDAVVAEVEAFKEGLLEKASVSKDDEKEWKELKKDLAKNPKARSVRATLPAKIDAPKGDKKKEPSKVITPTPGGAKDSSMVVTPVK